MPFRLPPAVDEESSFDDSAFDLSSDDEEDGAFLTVDAKARMFDRHSRAADRLSIRLLQEEDEDRVLRETLRLSSTQFPSSTTKVPKETISKVFTLFFVALLALAVLGALAFVGIKYVGPPNQPVGPYQLIELQEGMEFFSYYNFYEGHDSVGSNGYLTYVGEERALALGIVNVTNELDLANDKHHDAQEKKPFVYMGSAATADGPRESIRLEGKRRLNRGLFVIDLRHMPAGCGVWPAFWLTDEANWPVNGEIDIVEGVNYQSVAKTAMHTTKGCSMSDVPPAVKTGEWDTAIGIPNSKTGVPDMTLRYATDCFVYNPKQWLNQGCVAVDSDGNGTLGQPLNAKGGGVYALEWDPINRHIRTWVFAPHTKVPHNLRESIRTASAVNTSERVLPDPEEWPLPYGYFAIGDETDCPQHHFRNMRLVFNLAFCGSVAGNRFRMDCPKQAKKYKTCNDWIKSNPPEMEQAYWKIRGVYVYEREWQRAWNSN